jgi:hypothetical protein
MWQAAPLEKEYRAKGMAPLRRRWRHPIPILCSGTRSWPGSSGRSSPRTWRTSASASPQSPRVPTEGTLRHHNSCVGPDALRTLPGRLCTTGRDGSETEHAGAGAGGQGGAAADQSAGAGAGGGGGGAGRKKYPLKDARLLATLANGDTIVEATGYRKRQLLARLDAEGDKVQHAG